MNSPRTDWLNPPVRGNRLIAAALVALTLLAVFAFAWWRIDYRWDFTVLWRYRYKFLIGFATTLLISLASLAGSLLLGILTVLGSRSRHAYPRLLAAVYVEGIRGTPLLVQIIFIYFIFGTAFGLENKIVVGVLILSLFAGAYVAEILRGGLAAIPESQIETARSLCFTSSQTWQRIIIPQVARVVLPPLAGQFASLVKDSSLLSVIAVYEFAKNVTESAALNYRFFENYVLLAVGYLLITLPILRLTRALEAKVTHGS